MSLSIKQRIQQPMIRKKQKEYREECLRQEDSYASYAENMEQKMLQRLKGYKSSLTANVICISDCTKDFSMEEYHADLLIFIGAKGLPVPYMKEAVCEFFDSNPKTQLMYADEDYCLKAGAKLHFAPIHKPCWSPETLLSFNYIGEIFALRRECITIQGCFSYEEPCKNIYDFLLHITDKPLNVEHCEQVLFHRYADATDVAAAEKLIREADEVVGADTSFADIKTDALKRRNIEADWIEKDGLLFPKYAVQTKETVSILIPSKDNPEILLRCLQSVRKYTKNVQYEIIVIDNGSKEEVKKQLEEQAGILEFTYLYHPMDFNFSAMMNMAAAKATGEWLLLLNDDIEVLSDEWLYVMLGQAGQEGIGCVGAKLKYPNSDLIQHVGVTNAIDGPVHKLIGSDDKVSYYHGRNRLVYDVIAVTGACLLVKKSYFNDCSGLDELLMVAYNDVDLCFALFEKGLRNVVRNDVVLYHHESLSRGVDALSESKMARLKQERDYLYRKHPSLYYTDPYEGAFNNGGAEISLRPEYGIGEPKPEKMRFHRCSRNYRELSPGIYVQYERVEKEELMKTYEGEFFVISGWAILPESDNSRYTMKMVLMGEAGDYEMPMKKYYHSDIGGNFPNATNTNLCGFFCYVTEGEIPVGSYEIGIYAADGCSRQKLFQKTGKLIEIDK